MSLVNEQYCVFEHNGLLFNECFPNPIPLKVLFCMDLCMTNVFILNPKPWVCWWGRILDQNGLVLVITYIWRSFVCVNFMIQHTAINFRLSVDPLYMRCCCSWIFGCFHLSSLPEVFFLGRKICSLGQSGCAMGGWQPSVHSDVDFWSFDVDSSYHCVAEFTKWWIVHPLIGNVSWV